ncbi:unnamed protein product [Didymodactylos carnosus]|uniref:Potassium channel domain-containing protein n=1 Tax=Didymodactylos carnosus TaxID=1234261 RepID=A0A8S2JZT4_9BILA|nr:unnamed protein product [Didymodactylos carnosus]CAF3832848.1 unnamed protein product [Didymodactylos carnosus]
MTSEFHVTPLTTTTTTSSIAQKKPSPSLTTPLIVGDIDDAVKVVSASSAKLGLHHQVNTSVEETYRLFNDEKLEIHNISIKLTKRKQLHIKRRFISDIMCVISILSIILMVIENEIQFYVSSIATAANRIHREPIVTIIFKSCITLSTVMLLGLIIYYHRINLNIYCLDRSTPNNWRLSFREKHLLSVILELFICLIHPVPGVSRFSINENNGATGSKSYSPTDVLLSLPIFLRCYLIYRCIILHSSLVVDASSQSIGYLNRVKFNAEFISKSYIKERPVLFLFTVSIICFLIGSWSLRACEYNNETGHMKLTNAMYLYVITFITIGYGDITPQTHGGRVIVVLIGLSGVFSTALIFGIIIQKLELNRSQTAVHKFIALIGLSKERKHQSANIIKFAVKLWHLRYIRRRSDDRNTGRNTNTLYRKLWESIYLVRKIKREQRELSGSDTTTTALFDLLNLQTMANTTAKSVTNKVFSIERKVNGIEEKLDRIIEQMHMQQLVIQTKN